MLVPTSLKDIGFENFYFEQQPIKVVVRQLSKLLKSIMTKVTIFKYSRFLIEGEKTLKDGGAMRDRTADLLRARQALSQLSYSPICVDIVPHLPKE